jgi:putative membrane protein
VSGQETQPERTLLSWQRTGLGVLAVAALLGHRALRTGSTAPLLLAGAVLALGLAVLGGLAPWRARALHRLPAPAPVPAALATAAVVTAALAAAAAVLTR